MDPWNSGLNLITMLPPPFDGNASNKANKSKKDKFISKKIEKELISSKEISEQLNLGFKKIRELFKLVGGEPYYSSKGTFYEVEQLKAVKEILIDTESEIKVDLKDYISNQELMSMFNISSFKSWQIAKEHNIPKMKFKGNVAYYQKEKAISIYSKYVENI